MQERRLEGIVPKRIDAPYRSGNASDWIKVKCVGWRAANKEALAALREERCLSGHLHRQLIAAQRGALPLLPTGRRDANGASHDAAMDAAERSLQEQWPELSAKEASAEVVAAIAMRPVTTLNGSGMA